MSVSISLVRTLPESACRHGVDNPTLEDGDYYLHPDEEYELEPISINPVIYDAFTRLNPLMDFDNGDIGL